MPDLVELTPANLLRLCASADPNPWYPKVYARTSGTKRDALDAPLNDLRMAGLVQLTDWERDVGQGYRITTYGKEVLESPQLLEQLNKGKRPEAKVESIEPSAEVGPAPLTTFERGEMARNALLYPVKPTVAPVLIILNLLAFAAAAVLVLRSGASIGDFVMRGDGKALHDLGALSGSDLARGDWWRLLACCFLHWGIFHLALNMYSLYAQSRLLEALWGPPRFLLIFLLSAVGGSVAAMIYDPGTPDQQVLLAGASGGVWGLMTSTIAWIGLNREFLPPKLIGDWLRNWWGVLIVNIAVSFAPNVSASAHFGGGAIGVLVGSLLHYHRITGPGPLRSAITALLALMPVVFVGVLSSAMDSDPRWRRIVQAEQDATRKEALEIFRKGPATSVREMVELLDKSVVRTSELLKMPKKDRASDAVATAREELGKVPPKGQEALARLGDRAYAVEAAEKLRQAGREFTAAMKRLAEALDRALDPEKPEGDPSTAEIQKLAKEEAAARSKWELLLTRD